MTTYKVGYIVGSLATASINRTLAKALIRLAPPELEFVEVPIKDLPLYSYDYDADFPAEGRALKDALASVDAVLFVTPEYNRSIPGGLKNAIDWASRPPGQNSFAGKPSAVIGASPGKLGTALAQQSLRPVLGYCNSPQMTTPEAYIHLTPGVVTEDGEVTEPGTARFLQKFMAEFRTFIARVTQANTEVLRTRATHAGLSAPRLDRGLGDTVIRPSKEIHDLLGDSCDRPVVGDGQVLEPRALPSRERLGRRAQIVAASAGDVVGKAQADLVQGNGQPHHTHRNPERIAYRVQLAAVAKEVGKHEPPDFGLPVVRGHRSQVRRHEGDLAGPAATGHAAPAQVVQIEQRVRFASPLQHERDFRTDRTLA